MMRRGKYYVGDLCYVVRDEKWNEVCALTIVGHECMEGEFQLVDGTRFALYGTKYGDGEYFDQDGRKYGVDSGIIGCISLESPSVDLRQVAFVVEQKWGAVIDFDRNFATSGGRATDDCWDGVICVGRIRIETDYSEEEIS